jgi:hypothetical protein
MPFKPVVRVLLVTDDFASSGPRGGFLRWQDQAMPDAIGDESREFHLGEFVHCLEHTKWVGFALELTKATRTQPSAALSEAQLKLKRGADVVGFRFNQSFSAYGETRTLSNYDMVLFFPMDPGDPQTALAPEAEAIAQFMEQGGGFFATGDHENLGAKLAGLIPRVRSMRRWWSGTGPAGEPSAPPALGVARHDTTRAGADGITNFEDQSDDVAQEIEPRLYASGFAVAHGFPARKFLPHPLLCSPSGQVRWLPDHMHEGMVEVPANLASRTFVLAGASQREYPDYVPAGSAPGTVAAPLAPEVVATGKVLPNVTSPELDPEHTGGDDPAIGKTFGVIGAWDGHRVNRGRVVVDSTWHHFFDINISGDRYLEDDSLGPIHAQKLHGFFVPDGAGSRVPNAQYQLIMGYFRNIVYWLIPAKRKAGLAWQTVFELSRQPRLIEEFGAREASDTLKQFRAEHYLYFGQLAERYLSQARGHCAVLDVHVYLFEPKIPWWEWIQTGVDPWDPSPEQFDGPSIEEQRLGSLGLAMRPDAPATLALGAALVAAATMRDAFNEGAESARAAKAIRETAPAVLNQAVRDFGKRLSIANEFGRKLEKLISAQLANR